MRILVADDDATVRSELAALLREDGHDVDTAGDGAEAMRKLETRAFDAALLDLVMPRASGMEVLRRVRVASPETAVIMITGQGTIDAAVEAMKSGALDFIQKPPEIESIQHALRAAAEESRARQLLAGPSAGASAAPDLLREASGRKALLAVLGPRGTPPGGALRTLRIGEEPRPPDAFTPRQLYQVNVAVDAHIAAADKPVVYLSDLRPLEGVHGRQDLKAWIRQLRNRCAAAGGTLVVAGESPEFVSELESEAGDDEAGQGLQGMLESLANPTRRAIVSYVFASGPVAYSAILKRNFVDSSSKLSFHLQKLQADGLLTKADAGAYVLTDDGRRAWRVVRALSEGRRQPSLVFAPR